MEAVAQQPSAGTPAEQTAYGGAIGDRLRIHPHLFSPRLKSCATNADFETPLRRYSLRQGRSAVQDYAAALGP